MCLAQGHNAGKPVRPELRTPRTCVEHSTTALPILSISLNPLRACKMMCLKMSSAEAVVSSLISQEQGKVISIFENRRTRSTKGSSDSTLFSTHL